MRFLKSVLLPERGLANGTWTLRTSTGGVASLAHAVPTQARRKRGADIMDGPTLRTLRRRIVRSRVGPTR
jgi:hypothetical protein